MDSEDKVILESEVNVTSSSSDTIMVLSALLNVERLKLKV